MFSEASAVDHEKIIADFENELTLENLKANKNLLFSISAILEISINDFLQYAKNFKHSQSDLINALYYSKKYYFNYEGNFIGPRTRSERKVIVFRNYSANFKWNEIFSEYKILNSKVGGGKNEDLLYLYFEDEKTAIDAFNFYEKYSEEKEGEEKLPSCFMQCENLKHKILGIKPEDEDVEFKELPNFLNNQFKANPNSIQMNIFSLAGRPMIKPVIKSVVKTKTTPEKERKNSDQYELVKRGGPRKHFRYERKAKYLNSYSKNYNYNSSKKVGNYYGTKKYYDYGNGVKSSGYSYGKTPYYYRTSSYKNYIA